ncbi:PACS-1 cytosolic sorting protein domain-containing protein [Phthorimaea operculella]|nr:PACS-1 cytosolic sorting protein domain-containing protein [Phthorimaea operculella]
MVCSNVRKFQLKRRVVRQVFSSQWRKISSRQVACASFVTPFVMRLGKKKEKTNESESGRTQTVDGVARLICSAKTSHNQPLKVYIDGTEWNGVKFFQLSTQWQTHVKTFPVATCGAPLAPPET